jgi:transcriptional regulator with XRE-family HTH domain
MFAPPHCRVDGVADYKPERDRILKQFGLKLAKLRGDMGLSQERFAREANVHRNEIGALERGEREPGLLILLILADAAGVELADLTTGLAAPAARKPWPQAKRDAAGD